MLELCNVLLVAALAAATVTSCARTDSVSVGPDSATPTAAEPTATSSVGSETATVPLATPKFEEDLLAIAQSYQDLTHADGTSWAPLDCNDPSSPTFVSKAETGEHGRKIYTLFIKDLTSYAALTQTKIEHLPPPPVPALDGMTQVVVKESWHPVEASRFDERCRAGGPNFLRPVEMNGKTYRGCTRTGLFVMYKPSKPTEGTDEGWVYGTVAIDGGTTPTFRVSSAGTRKKTAWVATRTLPTGDSSGSPKARAPGGNRRRLDAPPVQRDRTAMKNFSQLLAVTATSSIVTVLGCGDGAGGSPSASAEAKASGKASDTAASTATAATTAGATTGAADTAAAPTGSAKACCSGKNECKGKGGCKTASNACAGKNECKGKGGCSMRDCK